MHITFHADQRMNQRGITKDMIRLALEHGEMQGDKIVMGQQEAQRLLLKLEHDGKELEHDRKELEHDRKVAKKLIDKGGVVVIADETVVITVYNCKPSKRGKEWKAKK